MAKVLTDIFSLFTFEEVCDSVFKKENIEDFTSHFSIIENLIIYEKVIVEKNGVRDYQLESMCNTFTDAIGYVTDDRLYNVSLEKKQQTTNSNIYERGMLYADVARDNEIYFSPHPNREKMFSENITKYVNATSNELINYVDQKVKESSSPNIANININIPPVVEHALYFSKTKKISISESINEIRNSQNAMNFRAHINDLDCELKELSPRKKASAYQATLKDIENLSNLWIQDMNEEVKYRKREINLTKIPVIGNILDVFGSGIIEINDPIIVSDIPHLLFINDLYTK